MNSKKDNLQAAAAILLIFLVVFTWAINKRDNNVLDDDLIKLTEEINTKLELLQELDTEQTELINQLTINLSDHEENIQINFDEINRLQAEIIDMKINNDRFSETAMIYCLDELWDYVKLVEKRIK